MLYLYHRDDDLRTHDCPTLMPMLIAHCDRRHEALPSSPHPLPFRTPEPARRSTGAPFCLAIPAARPVAARARQPVRTAAPNPLARPPVRLVVCLILRLIVAARPLHRPPRPCLCTWAGPWVLGLTRFAKRAPPYRGASRWKIAWRCASRSASFARVDDDDTGAAVLDSRSRWALVERRRAPNALSTLVALPSLRAR